MCTLLTLTIVVVAALSTVSAAQTDVVTTVVASDGSSIVESVSPQKTTPAIQGSISDEIKRWVASRQLLANMRAALDLQETVADRNSEALSAAIAQGTSGISMSSSRVITSKITEARKKANEGLQLHEESGRILLCALMVRCNFNPKLCDDFTMASEAFGFKTVDVAFCAKHDKSELKTLVPGAA